MYHYRKTVLVIASLFIASAASAEWFIDTKAGYNDMVSDEGKAGVTEEVTVGKSFKYVDTALSFSHFNSSVQGTMSVPGGDIPIGQVGMLQVYPLMFTVAVKPFPWLYVGTGAGIAFTDFTNEKYDGQATSEDKFCWSGFAGIRYKNFFVEYRRLTGDLAIESGNSGIGIMERKSNINSNQIMVGMRFTF